MNAIRAYERIHNEYIRASINYKRAVDNNRPEVVSLREKLEDLEYLENILLQQPEIKSDIENGR